MKKAGMKSGSGITGRAGRLCSVFGGLLLVSIFAVAQESPAPVTLSDRVLVVFNSKDSGSRDVAKYYAKMRGIPEANMCAIAPSDSGLLGWKEYLLQVKAPVQKCLTAVGREKVLYIVFSYQTPFRIQVPDKHAINEDVALDQHVADIWDQLGPDFPRTPPAQPYYAHAQSKANIYLPYLSLADYRAQANSALIYSVWRLDGANARLAKGLVDKAIEAEKTGLKGEGLHRPALAAEYHSGQRVWRGRLGPASGGRLRA